jgi:hypothetical protein
MTLFIVTVLSLITWLPYIITIILTTLNSSYVLSYNIGFQLIDLIHLTNSLINPIIYVFRMRDFRKALAQLIFKCSHDRHRTHPIGHHGHHGHHGREQPPIELGVM